MRYLFCLAIIFLIAGCAGDGAVTSHEDDNLFINLRMPDDPLVETIKSYAITVTAIDLAEAYTETGSFPAAVGDSVSLSTFAPSGENRMVTLHLLQSNGRIIFWARQVTDIPAESIAVISMTALQSAANSASRIKIFRDGLPWNSQALDNVLNDLGLTLGSGDNQYQVISSASFDTVTLIAGEDLVIIANDQSQEFYDNYHSFQNKIETFVTNGGTIFWEACDLGWAGGSIREASIELPGNVSMASSYETHNYLTSSLWQMTSGLDSVLCGNYASHEGFMDLPSTAIAYTVDSRYLPTLISFNHGVGWAILTGQPLEYCYDHDGDSNSGLIISCIVRFVLGLDGEQVSIAEANPIVPL